MNTLSRLVRTTAFKLSAAYLAVFALFAVGLVFYIGHATSQMMRDQLNQTIDAEVKGLSEQYRQGGLRRLASVVERRSRQPGASLYLITDFAGNVLTGNIAHIDEDVFANPPDGLRMVRYRREGGGDDDAYEAVVQVFPMPGNFYLLVGRDVSEGKRFRKVIDDALRWIMVVVGALAILSWVFVGRRVLQRIDSVSKTSRRIMAGDLSRRLQVTGSGDEFDRLSENVNAMLDRIEQLMLGLKDVSDNIAHDLKTPLTRLRNRVEAALREDPSEEGYRAALEATIEDSDQLIRLFNALLRIARVEAGSPDEGMARIDAGEIAREVAELYEPVAEEAGVGFTLDVDGSAPIEASRELVAQALANLIDNALKYGRAEDGEADNGETDGESAPAITLSVRREGTDVTISVGDRGPGIAAEDRERVRRRFVRLETSRSEPGSGLGLALAQAVAGLHRGTLELDDNAPGLRVTMRLPLAETGTTGGGVQT
ncbi:ATP-binding protein [Breoghania sp. L-A4]|uniref:sensor histidine kinase n=1 Tax=Breoghania sp. L-A4 TaxID=2304600 RepID=UPI000E35945A|nr:ATP-binding protein [Breoghania sp. L-A4]AXS39986.1 HAMP domain-containing protein [Breoghania sp. L-A4]